MAVDDIKADRYTPRCLHGERRRVWIVEHASNPTPRTAYTDLVIG
jgi:hypothetical protein